MKKHNHTPATHSSLVERVNPTFFFNFVSCSLKINCPPSTIKEYTPNLYGLASLADRRHHSNFKFYLSLSSDIDSPTLPSFI